MTLGVTYAKNRSERSKASVSARIVKSALSQFSISGVIGCCEPVNSSCEADIFDYRSCFLGDVPARA